MGLLSFGTVFWFAQKPDANPRVREPLLQIALIYRWFGLAMSIAWICQYIPARERIWVLGLLGVGIFIAAGQWGRPGAVVFCAGFSGTGRAWFLISVF